MTFSYPEATAPALRDVSLEIAAGQFTLVIGPSGSGKSTLLRCINGLVPHFSGGALTGRVPVDGLDTREHPPRDLASVVGFVFQDPEAQFVTERVEDELAFALENAGVPPLTMRKRVEEVLDALGIASLRHRAVSSLSGGEQQRVAIAAALALQPKILVLDEPTSQLDPQSAEDVLSALVRLNADLGLDDRPGRASPGARAAIRRSRGVSAGGRQRRPCRRPAPGDGGRCAHAAAGDAGQGAGMEAVAARRSRKGETASARDVERGAWKSVERRAEHDARRVRRRLRPPIQNLWRSMCAMCGWRTMAREVLRGIRWLPGAGEFVALMGRNGSGKTTLLRSLVGLVRPQRGQVRVNGQDVRGQSTADICRHVGYVPQDPGALLFADAVRDELLVTLPIMA